MEEGKMNNILIPTLAIDISLLERLVKSIDYPIKNKVIINNGEKNALDKWHSENPEWTVLHYGRNIGVGGSWNLAPTIFNDDYWLIVNDDHELQPGCLERICTTADNNYRDVPVIYTNESRGFDMFVWTRLGISLCGFFDENFYPGYHEDFEMRLRFALTGVDGCFVGELNFPMKHGKPLPGGPRYRAFLDMVDASNREYYIRKWGDVTDKVTDKIFKTPFNDPNNKVDYWIIERQRYERLCDLWNEFLNVPEPSLYK
jgi:hypothetical protein